MSAVAAFASGSVCAANVPDDVRHFRSCPKDAVMGLSQGWLVFASLVEGGAQGLIVVLITCARSGFAQANHH